MGERWKDLCSLWKEFLPNFLDVFGQACQDHLDVFDGDYVLIDDISGMEGDIFHIWQFSSHS